ncbi:SDR family NAD(P)-dependent oxidoreductase [Hoeflea olei]|uniref:Short-chain dehydrogenase n=1 Tax=Hoeflea olei TaxID=1480615 RepID=A0A1C1YU69_9HYPH|nr:SDR family oxidoreductase [Hoeflea olei]OCW57108.1 short-chain dehydrogenase [Hoeflea olei]
MSAGQGHAAGRKPGRALVTGGAHGLGAAFVRRLLAEGCEVTVLDKDPAGIDTAQVDFIRCDLASRESLDRTLPDLVTAGPYDLVILNAGINATGRFEDISAEAHLEILRVNAEAPMVIASRLLGTGAFTPSATLGFVSSLSHFTGYPGGASYAASKDVLAVHAKGLRAVAARKGVGITVAFPGPLRTAHAERHAPKGADASRRMDPDLAAIQILADMLSGRKTSVPGRATHAFAIAGRLMPRTVTALMRRLIYRRLVC